MLGWQLMGGFACNLLLERNFQILLQGLWCNKSLREIYHFFLVMSYSCDNLMVPMHKCKLSEGKIPTHSLKTKNKHNFKYYYQVETSGMIFFVCTSMICVPFIWHVKLILINFLSEGRRGHPFKWPAHLLPVFFSQDFILTQLNSMDEKQCCALSPTPRCDFLKIHVIEVYLHANKTYSF